METPAMAPEALDRAIEILLSANPELDQALRLFAISAEEYAKAFLPPSVVVSGSTSSA